MLDLISRGSPGHGPVHLLLISAAELGFAWDGGKRGWVRPSLTHLWMMTGPSSIWDAWRFRVSAQLAERRVSGVSSLRTLRALHNNLPLPT